MQKVTAIGECSIDITFPTSDSNPAWPLQLSAEPADAVFQAAAALGSKGETVTFVSDAARDELGSLLVGYLNRHGVNTSCIDRFSDGGATPSYFLFPEADSIPNRNYPQGESFNAPWPRIDAGDAVIFGGFFALDERSRPQVAEIVAYSRERKATTIYLPGFRKSLVPRITRVMPSILENLEMASIVVATGDQLETIFGLNNPADCFERHIRFYSPTLLVVGHDDALTAFHRNLQVACKLPSGGDIASVTSALVTTLFGSDIDDTAQLSPQSLKAIIGGIASQLSPIPTK